MREQKFREEIKRWKQEFKIKELFFERDDYIPYAACIFKIVRSNIPLLSYNWPMILEYGKDYKWILFHELGHVINKSYLKLKNTEKDQIKSEYLAEKFAMNMIEKYYPEELPNLIKENFKRICCIKWATSWPIHAKAFNKVYTEKLLQMVD